MASSKANGSLKAEPGLPGLIPASLDVDFGPEDEALFKELARETIAAQVKLERIGYATLDPIFRKRNAALLKQVPKIWPVAMLNHMELSIYLSAADDMDALSYLRTVNIVRDEREPRAYRLDFEFAENPYFNNKTLSKQFKYIGTAKATPPEEVTPEHIEYKDETHLDPQPFAIDWKEGKSLTAAMPRPVDEDGDVMESGSFFNFFEEKEDPYGIAGYIAEHVYPDVMDYFLGKGEFCEQGDDDEVDDVTDEEEEDEDDEDEEIDLEAPPKKRRRAAK